MFRVTVLQTDSIAHLLSHTDFLASAVDELELALRKEDGERHTRESTACAEVENLGAWLEADKTTYSQRVEHVVFIEIIDILSGYDVNLLIPFMIERIELFKLRILLVGELGKILFNQFHGTKIQIIMNKDESVGIFLYLCTRFFKKLEMNQLKAALFDLDGVVFDTEPQYTVFWGSQCRLYHPEHPGLEHEIKGSTLDQIYDKWWNGDLVKEREKVTERLNAFEAQMDYTYIAGLEAFIVDLHKNGVKTAVVTSSNKPKMESVFKARPEFTTLFDAILTSEDFAESKPSPDCYLRGAKRFGLQPSECVVLEDSFNGLKSGRAAGMFVVGLATTNKKEDIAPLSDIQIADYEGLTFDCLKEIINIKH